jgi:membrane protein implicated in regulation of membrane protease activity
MQWWAWIAVGAILLGSELGFVDAQFYLVFVGAAALLVGVLDLGGLLDMKQGPVGETVVLPAALPPGETCRLEYCGSSWNAVNGGKSAIAAGQRARIARVNGLTLIVHGENS